MSNERAKEFCGRVRDAYLDIYGSDGLETDEPFHIDNIMVLATAQFLDGEESTIMVRDGSRMACLGLAREGIYYLLPNETD